MSEKQTCRDMILKALYFRGGFSTDIFFRIQDEGGNVGIHSLTNRLQELQAEGKIVSRAIEGRKEKFWEIARPGELPL